MKLLDSFGRIISVNHQNMKKKLPHKQGKLIYINGIFGANRPAGSHAKSVCFKVLCVTAALFSTPQTGFAA